MPAGLSSILAVGELRMRKLLIATNNKGKVLEIRALLQDLNVVLITPSEIGLRLRVAEDGLTYADNASRKAIAFAEASGLVALADDSGLEVAALGGAPGLHSARYLRKRGATDAERRAYLLSNLRGRPRPWQAQFHSAIAIGAPGQTVHVSEGTCDGEIIPEERGTGGFGYDRIFFMPATGQTMAELSLETKNIVSHRARAVLAARPFLIQLLS